VEYAADRGTRIAALNRRGGAEEAIIKQFPDRFSG